MEYYHVLIWSLWLPKVNNEISTTPKPTPIMSEEDLKNLSEDNLKGYIKSAEARKRLKDCRKTIQTKAENEIRGLIEMQPTALQGVRLETMMIPLVLPKFNDPLSPTERKRLNSILKKEPEWLNQQK